MAKKVEKIIGKIRQRIDQAIDKVLLKAKGLFKGKNGKGSKNQQSKEKVVEGGLRDLHVEENKYLKDNKITKAVSIQPSAVSRELKAHAT
ncbi:MULTISPECIES: hypothetical protein [unclassified Moorena]|nr:MULTISPECIES: hypothetical protein [unclassified Moorena]NEQ16690.1 hypothetical protein [Moorena sp. SIO3E2]NEP68631.1 hypothetical protein [Moorena sp. SIO3A5]NEQ11839.1 hypothetical protein [Moorena sp. SIO4E2]NER90403.1 hypothetical protein [Moorena sp. SIO3A2]NES46855.1 hypothetical protein [Moorena sp. SIO2C4]